MAIKLIYVNLFILRVLPCSEGIEILSNAVFSVLLDRRQPLKIVFSPKTLF